VATGGRSRPRSAPGGKDDAVIGLIRYPEERAVEDAAFGLGLTPTRLCRMLLPVWRADVRATIYDSEPSGRSPGMRAGRP
jgi:hypothetical protein